jgi:16S rRNA (cytidine1402-2'-O)-methyltransferase
MSKLYIVPTPIGNLEDMTLRAIRILKESAIILSEDTRTSGFLLKHFDIKAPLWAHHKFNEHRTVESLAQRIASGESISLVSDAGTPGISDPGFLLIRTCIEHGVDIECLPGPTAFIPALVISGLPCDRFVFEGFLPQKKGRNKRIEALKSEERTIVFYESPYRLVKLLQQLMEIFEDDRNASVSRELTKLHEETIRGKLSELIGHFQTKGVKGEIVVVVDGAGKETKSNSNN